MGTYCGVDFHARQQHIAYQEISDEKKGESKVEKLLHSSREEVKEFYSKLSQPIIVGIEASGYSEWFIEMLFELGHEVRIGNASEIRKRARSRHKNDRRDAELILDLLIKDEFPQIYLPTSESKEILMHLRNRHRLVKMRTMAANHLNAISLKAGVSLRKKVLTAKGRKKLEELKLSTIATAERKNNGLI